MSITEINDVLALVLMIIGTLVALTNIVVEVLKAVTSDKLPTQLLVFIVAIVLTMLAFLAWAHYSGFAILWYYIVAAVIVGVMVAYAAMFGFDKLKEMLNRVNTTE